MKKLILALTAVLIIAAVAGCEDGKQEQKPAGQSAGAQSTSAGLYTQELPELYSQFLQGEISIPAAGEESTEGGFVLSFFAEEGYDEEFSSPRKRFALCDVTGDGQEELIFQVSDDPDELLCIIGIEGDGLVCCDVWETHTPRMGFELYDNGILCFRQTHTGVEEIYYQYGQDGNASELLHFVRTEDSAENSGGYDYYYRDGDASSRTVLTGNEDYEEAAASCSGGELKWYNCSE